VELISTPAVFEDDAGMTLHIVEFLGELFAFFAWTTLFMAVFVSIVATASYITIKMIEYIIQYFRE
jgi:hypothetical protein